MLDIVGKRYWWFLISLLIIIPGIVSLLLFQVKLGIDFTGGTIWELEFSRGNIATAEMKAIFSDHGFPDTSVQTIGDTGVLIRTREIKSGDQKTQLAAALTSKFGKFQELRFEAVGPAVGQEVTSRALIAVAAAAVGILLYISYAFRKVKKPFRYGACAIIAMIHDVLVVVGIFSLLGHFFGMEVDAMFVTAVLTVIGFSVHDTIVVFDRIRENVAKYQGEKFETVVNHSVLQTLARSLNTSLTVVVTLAAVLMFGGVTIRTFVLTLLIGIVSGTYSSIFNASQILVVWENGELPGRIRKFFGRASRSEAAV
jgi:preprotein translocase subunit SecF